MRSFTRALSCLALLLLPTVASAQGRFELTPFVSYRFGGEVEASDSDFFRRDVDVEDSEAFGVSFGIPLTYNMQLEFLASQQESEFTVDGGLFEPSFPLADVDITYYHVGLLWGFGQGQVVPFFTISGGITDIEVNAVGSDSETRGSLSLGGGAKVFFNEHVGMRFEGRGFWTALDDDNDDDDWHDRWDDDDDEVLSQAEAKVGLIIAF